MTDLENREAFEKWFKKSMYHKHLKENFWDAWNTSAQREGFKLVPLEPTKEMIKQAEKLYIVEGVDIFSAVVDAV